MSRDYSEVVQKVGELIEAGRALTPPADMSGVERELASFLKTGDSSALRDEMHRVTLVGALAHLESMQARLAETTKADRRREAQ